MTAAIVTTMATDTRVPESLRIAVRNAMGGEGPYSVREIRELFRTYRFTDTVAVEDDDVHGERRRTAEEHLLAINWHDANHRKRLLMLVDEVSRKDGVSPDEAHAIARALRLVDIGESVHETEPVEDGGLWKPPTAPRIFLSHRSDRRADAQELADALGRLEFASFVAHHAIPPSREWRAAIQTALRSCDLLIALVAEGFHDSEWTDQEVGWVLGRDLAIVPVSLDGTLPKGFLESYQAIKRKPDEAMMGLSTRILEAICDAVFREQRSQAGTVSGKIVSVLLTLLGNAKKEEGVKRLSEMLVAAPEELWTDIELREQLSQVKKRNGELMVAAGVDRRLGALLRAHGSLS